MKKCPGRNRHLQPEFPGHCFFRFDQSSLEEHLGCVMSRSILLAGLHLAQQINDDRMVRVHLQSLAPRHHAELFLVLEDLGLHDHPLPRRLAELKCNPNPMATLSSAWRSQPS